MQLWKVSLDSGRFSSMTYNAKNGLHVWQDTNVTNDKIVYTAVDSTRHFSLSFSLNTLFSHVQESTKNAWSQVTTAPAQVPKSIWNIKDLINGSQKVLMNVSSEQRKKSQRLASDEKGGNLFCSTCNRPLHGRISWDKWMTGDLPLDQQKKM